MSLLLSFGGLFFYSPVKDVATPSFDAFQRETNFTWPAQQRLNRDPAHQFTGPGEDNVTIEGILYPHMFGGLATLDRFRAIGRTGDPYELNRYYLDSAVFIGRFVLKRVNQKDTMINSGGTADRVEFTLELSKYGDDGFNSLQ